MGRPHRDKMKRKLVSSHNNLERSYEGIVYLHSLFDGVHPHLAEALEVSAKLIFHAQEVLEAFGIEAWNFEKETYDSYR